MTACLPVVRREGSISALRAAAVRRLRSETRLRAQRPLLAALRPTATIPPASLSYKCARAARTPYLLFIIYYLLSIIYYLPLRGTLVPDGAPVRNVSGNRNKKTALLSPVNLYLPFISPGTLPRANKAPLGLCCRSVRKATDTPCSRPRWCICPQYPGKSQ